MNNRTKRAATSGIKSNPSTDTCRSHGRRHSKVATRSHSWRSQVLRRLLQKWENQPRLSITGCVRAAQLMRPQSRPGLLWPIDRGINTHKAPTGPAWPHISRQLTSGCLGFHATLPQHAPAAPAAFSCFYCIIFLSFCSFICSHALDSGPCVTAHVCCHSFMHCLVLFLFLRV